MKMKKNEEGGTGSQMDEGVDAGRRVAEELLPRGRWGKRENFGTFL